MSSYDDENNDGTITVNNVTYDMTKSDLGSIAQISEDFNNLPNGLTFVSTGQNNAPESTSAYWVRTFSSSAYGGRKLQVAQADSSNNRYIRTYNGSWNNWDSLATGSELNSGLANKVTDNKNGTIKVNGSSITPADNNTVNNELSYKVTDNNNGSITVNGATFIPADNSKVAKLSGNNNFDTVPEVDNNPLLLASSLPSDLARTGQASTFTAAQTFSIAPTITDASKDKGDNQAATMADLKSVENSAWIQLDSTNGTNRVALCRIDGNKLWVVWMVEQVSGTNGAIGEVPQSIQGKNFSEFNLIYGDITGGTDAYIVAKTFISSNSIMVSYNSFTDSDGRTHYYTNGYVTYGYFTFE